jgi:hypothetical protein
MKIDINIICFSKTIHLFRQRMIRALSFPWKRKKKSTEKAGNHENIICFGFLHLSLLVKFPRNEVVCHYFR